MSDDGTAKAATAATAATATASGGCGCGCGCAGGACGGIASSIQSRTGNRAGLPALSFRVGTHASFLDEMKARLAAADLPALAALRTRESRDFSIALLDACATIGDVLTFYQERIANEGYIRTATERLSIVELARLIGYELRPGVAASVYLAYTLNDGPEVPIPAGARAQSTPGPDESPQFFETAEELRARADWNDLKLRSSKLPDITSDSITGQGPGPAVDVVFFTGAANNLKAGDRLLFQFGSPVTVANSAMRQIQSVEVIFKDDSKNIKEDRTKVTLVPISAASARAIKALATAKSPESAPLRRFAQAVRFGTSSVVLAKRAETLQEQFKDNPRVLGRLDAVFEPAAPRKVVAAPQASAALPFASLRDIVGELVKPPTRQPLSAARLVRDLTEIFNVKSDIGPRLLGGFFPGVRENVYLAFATPQPVQEVSVFRQTAFLFGNNAPKKSLFERPTPDPGGEINLKAARKAAAAAANVADGEDWQVPGDADEQGDRLFMDNAYPSILPGDIVVVESATLAAPKGAADTDGVFLGTVEAAAVHPRSAFRVSGPTTEVTFQDPWWEPSMDTIRDAVVFTRAEKLTLAREPITDPLGGEGDAATHIDLDRVYPGLAPGRWIIVSGVRRISDTVGIPSAELVMIAAVDQNGLLPNSGNAGAVASASDPHTVLVLAGEGLAFTYRRETVKIYGNVVLATHGETRNEVLGAGDATRALQTFTIKKPPLTYVPAPTASGIASTLEVRVNDIIWREAPSLAALGPSDRRYIVRVADDGTTSITFGTGEKGARLPTGAENVKAIYRSGIGRVGNVDAQQVNLLQTRPLGVKDVVNPLPASGGADADTKDQARRNAPQSVTALDRLVSVSDYAAFARSFAGIAKAAAERLTRNGRPLIHVTVSGQENVPISRDSLLFTSLVQAVEQLGDPALPIDLTICPVAFLFVKAGVRIAPDRIWEVVQQQIRSRLSDRFGFDRRDLGQSLFLSEVIAAIQNVDGVDYVDVDALAAIGETEVAAADNLDDLLGGLAAGTLPDPPVVSGRDAGATGGARVVYLNPTLPDLLILTEIAP